MSHWNLLFIDVLCIDHAEIIMKMRHSYGKCSKTLRTFFFLISNKILITWTGIHKKLIRKTNRQDADQTTCASEELQKKQSDLGLHFLSTPFLQATCVLYFRASTLYELSSSKSNGWLCCILAEILMRQMKDRIMLMLAQMHFSHRNFSPFPVQKC